MKFRSTRDWPQPTPRKTMWVAISSIFLLGIVWTMAGAGPNKSLGGELVPNSSFRSLSDVSHNAEGPNFSLDDRWNQTFTWFDYNGRTVCKGEIPKWNPNEFNGFSYLPIGSTGPLSPYLLATCPIPRDARFTVAVLAEFYVTAFGLFFLLRSGFRLRVSAATFGAVTFAFSGVVTALSLFPHGFTGSWIGFLALLPIQLRRSTSTKQFVAWGAAYAAIVALCGFTGQPEMFAITLGGGLATAYLAAVPKRGPRESFKNVSLILGFAVLGACLAAPQLLPAALFTKTTALGEQRHLAISHLKDLNPAEVVSGLRPYVSSVAVGMIEPILHGPPSPSPTLTTKHLPYSRITNFVGWGVIAVWIAFIVRWVTNSVKPSWRQVVHSQHFRVWTAAFLSSLVMTGFPLTQGIIARLPLLSRIDVSFFRWLTTLLIALGAALLLQSVLSAHMGPMVIASLAALSFMLAITLFALSRVLLSTKVELAGETSPWLQQKWLQQIGQGWRIHLSVALLGILVLLFLRKSPLVSFCTVVLVALQMLGSSVGKINFWGEVYPIVDEVREKLIPVRDSGQRLLTLNAPFASFGTLFEVQTLSGYELMGPSNEALARSVRSCKAEVSGVLLEFCEHPVSPPQLAQFGNIGWVLGPKGLNLKKEGSIGAYDLYRSEEGLGQAFFIKGDNCSQYRRLNLDRANASLKATGGVRVVRNAAGSSLMTFQASQSRRCLFVSEAYAPGWRAQEGDEIRPVGPFAGVWQTVEIKPGQSRIELVYDPPGYSNGLIISGLALLSLLAVLAGTVATHSKGHESSNDGTRMLFGFKSRRPVRASSQGGNG